MPRFAANLGYLYTDRPLLQRIDAAAASGFKAVELQLPYDVPAAHVKAALARNDMAVLGLNTPTGEGEFGLAAVPGREKEWQAAFARALDYITEIGGSAIHCLAGKVAAFTSWDLFHFIINQPRAGLPVFAGWDIVDRDDPKHAAELPMLRQIYRKWDGLLYDSITFRFALDYIKEHQPRYNTALKRTKHFRFVRVDGNDPFPRLDIVGEIEADGATPIVSFGGAGGTELAMACTTESSLQAAYQSVINHLGVNHIDFDIEGAPLDYTADNNLRFQAIAGLESANPGLVVSVTTDPVGKAAQDAAQLGLTYPVLSDPDGMTAQAYQAFALPTLFVIDRDLVGYRNDKAYIMSHSPAGYYLDILLGISGETGRRGTDGIGAVGQPDNRI